MCDTLCVLGPERTIFAKNSDRPVGERQLVEAHPPRPAGGRLRTTHLAIDDAGACTVVGSRPEWCWGFEHGVNEHRVAIGNEKIWTVDDPTAARPALIGMDLVRLGLERARNADEALEVMTALLTRHGQGGNCEANGEPYWSSFLIADPTTGWVLETSGRTWAARRVAGGATISNRLTLSTDWDRASPDVRPGTDFDTWRDPRVPTAIGDHRLAVTRGAIATREPTIESSDLTSVLRDHGGASWGAVGRHGTAVPPPREIGDDFAGITVCMHLRDYQVTTAALISEQPLEPDAPMRAWACMGSPCVGIFVPIFPPADVPTCLADPRTWDRFDGLRRRVEHDPSRLPSVRAVLDPLETELWQRADALSDAERSSFLRSVTGRLDAALVELGR